MINYFFKSGIDWLFRRRSPALMVFRTGFWILLYALTSSIFLGINYQDLERSLTLSYEISDNSGIFLQYGSFILGSILCISGAIWEFYRDHNQIKAKEKRRAIVIEQRGLRDTSDTPLISAIPPSIPGQRDSMLIDIRERISDGLITHPKKALEKINTLKSNLEQRLNGLNKSDVDIFYGGLLPIPFTFLSGFLLDDESQITVFDWDRQLETWRMLDGVDDGHRFKVSSTSANEYMQEVVLAVSVSYKVDLDNIASSFPKLPLVHMQLDELTINGHWSAAKQSALAIQFLNEAKKLGDNGFAKIHLVIAAPNSVTFKLGRSYDKRNLPQAVIYQYERSQRPAYPWGVFLPTHGIEEAKIVNRDEY